MKITGLVLLPFLTMPAAALAQSSPVPQVAAVRGMLMGNIAKNAKPNPAAGFLVTVEGNNYTSPAVRSGKDGLYYIPDVVPGKYMLKVWADPNRPLSFPVTIKGPLTDIPPVIVEQANATKANPPAAKPKPGAGKKAKPVPPAAKPIGGAPPP